ncbi:MAG: hypothetical protein ACLUZZ_03045 [Alistipes inops]
MGVSVFGTCGGITVHPAAGGLSIYFLVYYLQHLFFELFGLACDAFRFSMSFSTLCPE